MKALTVLSFVALGVLTTACGGYSNLGDPSEAGQGGDDAGTGGTGRGGSGNAMGGTGNVGTGGMGNTGNVGTGGMGNTGNIGSGGSSGSPTCAGLACGSLCALDGMNYPPVGQAGYCDAFGNCNPQFPMCAGDHCRTDADCPVIDCQPCSDGTGCEPYQCVNGTCVLPPSQCAECNEDSDCPVLDVACRMCEDGTSSCPGAECTMGRCFATLPACNDPSPCANLACGDPCDACPGGDAPCDPIARFCNDRGECTTEMSVCPDPGECKATSDCPALPPICIECPNGSCAGNLCLDGTCDVACFDETPCMTASDCPECGSCGGGDACSPYECVASQCILRCDNIGSGPTE